MRADDLGRLLRQLEPSGWSAAARLFAGGLRSAAHEPGRLLVVGTPAAEPWHLTAHLADTARWTGQPQLQPVLVRHAVPAGAPAHLSVGLDAVSAADRRSTVLLAADAPVDELLLERLADARRGGAGVLAVAPPQDDLADLAHDRLDLPPVAAPLDLAGHVLSEPVRPRRRRWARGAA